ncbi:hypothetical protein AB0M46_45360 [Dactylosporangium sp. NPDC051485]|uniref:hypothetical protein n=1 Tax=Dactylosporangium sp. NPDC051485 TaxID=3154846 RepID=UPI0034382DD4
MLCLLGWAGWLGWRRHTATVPVLAATAALLCCDAWFDVLLGWRAAGWTQTIALALVEVPMAGLLLLRARHLLAGGMVTRRLTLTDLDLHTDTTAQRVLRAYLTEAELAQFEAEYLDLLLRYAQRRDAASDGVRPVALRCYAFPQTLLDEVDQSAKP